MLTKSSDEGQAIRVNQINTHNYDFTFLEAGDGPLVLMLHGFPDNPYTFTSQLKALAAAGYHAVAPYKCGFAPNDSMMNPIHHAAMYMQDAVKLVEAFNGKHVILVGHDWGA